MNEAYLSHIRLDAGAAVPLYAQLRDAFRHLVVEGVLKPGIKLPSSRILCSIFGIHRQTVVAAMDELIAEGWVKAMPRRGLYVNDKLPLVTIARYGKKVAVYPSKAGFNYNRTGNVSYSSGIRLPGFDDGFPDGRLAPVAALGKAYVQTLHEKQRNNSLSKTAPNNGSLQLRKELAAGMVNSRGMAISEANIMITHGSQMSIYLISALLLNRGDHVIVSDPGYAGATNSFRSFGARIHKVGVDGAGMLIREVEQLCRRMKVACVFVTSHHHHPTTVTMSIERRLQLLQLAVKYGFAIIEDDYDYDFHYQNKPLMPIASNDRHGHVIYIGSLSKILSHNFRIGYVIGPEDFIRELSLHRKVIDRQGDPVLEEAIAKLYSSNIISSHLKKALNIYRDRRDAAYHLLTTQLGNYLELDIPEGGLAFWVHFDPSISLPKLSERCALQRLRFPDASSCYAAGNACRLGFASMNEREMERAVNILRTEIGKSRK